MFYRTDWLKFKFKNQKPVIEISLTYFLTATLAYLQKLPDKQRKFSDINYI